MLPDELVDGAKHKDKPKLGSNWSALACPHLAASGCECRMGNLCGQDPQHAAVEVHVEVSAGEVEGVGHVGIVLKTKCYNSVSV